MHWLTPPAYGMWVVIRPRAEGTVFVMLSADGDDAGLLAELGRSGSGPARKLTPGLVAVEADALPVLAWARQTLPDAERVSATSVNDWARTLLSRIDGRIPDGQPWRLHVVARYGAVATAKIGARAWHTGVLRGERAAPTPHPRVAPSAGEHRCLLIGTALRALLKERRRSLLKRWAEASSPWSPADSLVQLVLTSPDEGWLSVAVAPLPFTLRRLISPFVAGDIPIMTDPAPPSRAFAKLVEAQLRLGRSIHAGETCVDLGASPGGWSYVALSQGASVIAVDRSPLRADLMGHLRLTFVKGDALRYRPPAPVDWLICDVIAAPERSIDVLLGWLRDAQMRWFIVTIKLKGDPAPLDRLKAALPTLTDTWFLTHLCANKGEVCVFGSRSQPEEQS